MFCPRCGQQQVSEETRFCSRCGFLMLGVIELIASGGNAPFLQTSGENTTSSPRKRGLKQGLFIFLLTFLVVPIIAVLTVWANTEPFMVAIAAISLFVGGLLRMVYALMFESTNPQEKTLEQNLAAGAQRLLNKKPQASALPADQSIPAAAYVPPNQGNWRDTKDLTPTSITEGTTKLLNKDE
jgi:hypothetical protein